MVLAVGILSLAAWLLPAYLSAESYRRRLEAGLESVLHRPASFGSASFRLLPRPGFTLENVIIREDPAFGREPFARIDRVDCDLRWSTLWRRRMDFARLRLSRPSLNLARDERRKWNIEDFLVKTGVTRGDGATAEKGTRQPIEIEAEDARLNFKEGDNKRPFAIVGLLARLNFDPAQGRIRFQLGGNPVRTDLPYPPPGRVELSGEWFPGSDLEGVLDASLRTRGALLYNWVPMVTGANHEIYGVMDADARIHGSFQKIKVDGEASVVQLHRWEMLPPADPMPIRLQYRGAYDIIQGRVVIESAEASFAGSNLHLTGTVENISETPELDLVVALERSRLEDWSGLAHRLWRYPDSVRLSGRVDGLLTIQGHGADRRYGGFISAREARLMTPSGSSPISDLAVRVDGTGVRLAPVTISIAPRFVLGIEGAVHPATSPAKGGGKGQAARYEISMTAKSFSLSEAVRFARALGVPSAMRIDAHGVGNATGLLAGVAWPPAKPHIAVKGDVRSARLLVPGLTEPLNIPGARIQVTGDRIVIDSLTAVIGSSILTGRVGHQGPKQSPWQIDLKANTLSVEESAAWFDTLGHRTPAPLLERIPGLGSSAARRSAASVLFTSLNARGRFATPVLTYRALRLQDFETSLDLSGRILQLSKVAFHAGKGRGEGRARLDLTQSPAQISGEISVADLKLESFSNRLPPVLAKARGEISGTAEFRTRGLSRSEMSAYLEATGKARLEGIVLGDFDPLEALARRTMPEPSRHSHRDVAVRPAEIAFEIRDRKVSVVNQTIEMEGARLALTGDWVFNGPLDLEVSAHLRRVKREWVSPGRRGLSAPSAATIHLTGPFDGLVAQPAPSARQASR